MSTNEVTQSIIGAAIDVHRQLGPGLLESAYRACLAYELRKPEKASIHPVDGVHRTVNNY